MKFTSYIIFFMLIFSACKEKATTVTANTPNSKENTSLESQVIAIHDEVMPEMGNIHLAKKQLRKVMNETQNDSLKTKILQLIDNLEKADEGMMDWMDKWDVPEKNPEKTDYLQAEKIKITKVKVDMLSSIEAAKQFLSKMNNK